MSSTKAGVHDAPGWRAGTVDLSRNIYWLGSEAQRRLARGTCEADVVTVLAMAAANRSLSKALTVQSHWTEEILSGRKVWELRNQSRRIRGEVAVAANGQLLGQVNFDDAFLVSERDSGHAVIDPPGNEQNFLALPGNMAKHGVQDFWAPLRTRACGPGSCPALRATLCQFHTVIRRDSCRGIKKSAR